jgi:hypothetical protein
MGQAIVYCSNCSAQLRGSDFESRKAFKVDDLNFCLKCYEEVVGSAPPPAPAPLPPASTKNRIPIPSKTSHGTTSISIVPPGPAPESNATLYGILGAIGVAVLLLLGFVMSGGNDRPAAPAPATPPAAPPLVSPARPPAREVAAQEALGKALRVENLEQRRALLVEAVAQSAGTSLFNDAQRELARVEDKLAEARAAAAAKVPETKAEPVTQIPTPPPPPPPATAAPDRSREEAAALAKWEAAVSPATTRDYPAAVAALEKLGTAAADAALLKSVAALHQEAMAALGKLTKGQKVALEYRDVGGPRRVEGVLTESENGHLELRTDTAVIEIEIGELLPSTLVDLLKGRDPATAAVYALLEGDEAGARRLAGGATIAERYWAYGRKVQTSCPARALYAEAARLASGFTTAADAVPKYQMLLRDYAETPFVKRNKGSLTARAQQCARDYLFTSVDLKAAGTFKPIKSAKGFTTWSSDSDSEPVKMRENFVEFAYATLPETVYRCWVYAGGCCQEVFEFGAQGTEMKAGKEKEPVEPGSGAASTIKPYLTALKKTHSAHTGPKQPTHWDWVSIPLPRYSKGGVQAVRLLTNQKGFSIAFACVSASRTAPPRELELKELEKFRGAAPTVPAGPKPIVLYQPALDGTDRHLLGEVRDKSLFAVPLFNQAFCGTEGGPGFTMPPQGEVRMTYFLKTATALWVRFRVRRGGEKTEAHDAFVASPVVGRPAEARLPFASFKPMGGLPFSPVVSGDVVPMVYVVGEDPNCGLRLDFLSIVELRSEGAVAASRALFVENFDAGPGRFAEGEMSDGGTRGTKAYLLPAKGISCWDAFSIPVKETTTVSFRVKPLQEVPQLMILVWSDKMQENCRLMIDGLKKGEWKDVKFKASQLRSGASGDGLPLDVMTNLKIFQLNSPPEAKVLFDDFEIRE